MSERLRSHRQRDTASRPAEPAGGGPSRLRAIRTEAESLLAVADAAIERALSTDSQAFIDASRQRGGE